MSISWNKSLIEKLKKEYPDSKIINPMKLDHSQHDKSWEAYMKVCIIARCQCDMIAMLPNWQDSKGANVELEIATQLNFYTEFL